MTISNAGIDDKLSFSSWHPLVYTSANLLHSARIDPCFRYSAL